MRPAGMPTKEARAGLPSPAMSMRGTEKVAVELDIPSRIGMLETADVLVGHLATTAGFDLDSSQAIQTALHEALLNAIVHGNDEDETRRVNVELAARAGGLDVRVRDEGPGFDPTRVPDPLAPENLSKSSGRGIFLMRMLMDEVAFRCRADGGMEVTMRKRLSACEESA
jgi:serine/threonine-protein kinase RsbW